MATLSYALITPARNEAALIEGTLRSVAAQTVLPVRWIIVSDGSTDGTDDIVRQFMGGRPWLELLRLPEHRERHFAAKANAFAAGQQRLRDSGVSYDIIGNLDADITFEPDYFRFLMDQFAADPTLGVAGTPWVEDVSRPDRHTYAHRFVQLEHVSGACQMFRRACFEEVGGYLPIPGGAIDWTAVTTARMKGWRTRTFLEKYCLHHRPIGTATYGPLRARFHYGRKAFYIGGHPLWELLRGVFEMRHKPWILGGLCFQAGFLWGLVTRMKRPISKELVAFHQAEQMARLKAILIPSRHREREAIPAGHRDPAC